MDKRKAFPTNSEWPNDDDDDAADAGVEVLRWMKAVSAVCT